MDNRGATTVVAKLLAFGIVLLYVGGMATTLYGGAVPEYRDAVGGELGDRVLATAADRVQGSVPPDARAVSATTSVDLPASIRGASYDLRVVDESLVLEHPADAVGGQARLALPAHVQSVDGAWESGAEALVHVEGDAAGVDVRLREGEE